MFSRTPRAAGDLVARAWLIAFTMMTLAVTPAARAVVTPASTVDAFDLTSLQAVPAVEADGPDAAPAPAVAPLPPALATGLAGLAAMAVLRVGRRVYRRR